MYICNDDIWDPACDFCWFCKHDRHGVPAYCTKGKNEEFGDGLGYCYEFKCSLHEKQT